MLEGLLPTETSSPEATVALGKQLAEVIESGDVLALYGDLGVGKTHLVKGIASGLGVSEEDVTSPTFTLIQEYATEPPLYHLDVYRIEQVSELERMGVDEYLYGEGICVIEWPERMESMLPEHCIRLRLSHVDTNRRLIERISESDPSSRILPA